MWTDSGKKDPPSYIPLQKHFTNTALHRNPFFGRLRDLFFLSNDAYDLIEPGSTIFMLQQEPDNAYPAGLYGISVVSRYVCMCECLCAHREMMMVMVHIMHCAGTGAPTVASRSARGC